MNSLQSLGQAVNGLLALPLILVVALVVFFDKFLQLAGGLLYLLVFLILYSMPLYVLFKILS